ncbi:MAG TPA: hypothetical protein DCZ91_10055 [Lachnospiraceae bacterium]|nr:hypothetical protein [Lachnospiraceae bacterium]
MILADMKDYRNGYRKHYCTYLELKQNNMSVRSRRLLLTYCVECGLKYLLLDNWHESNPEKIIKNKKDKRNKIITSHNLEIILKELGQAGVFVFPQMTTVHKDTVIAENFHELCRYGIRIEKRDEEKESQYERELQKIAKWIGEEV